jgi:hypothetical protein
MESWFGYFITLALAFGSGAITFIWGYSRISNKIEELTAPEGRIANSEKTISTLIVRTDIFSKFHSAQEQINLNHSERYDRIEKKLEVIELLLRQSRRGD